MSNLIRYGVTNSISQPTTGKTVDQILKDKSMQAVLGFGDNVQARVNGRIVEGSYLVKDGETVDIETVANKKAASVNVLIRFGTGNEIRRAYPENTTIKSVLTDSSTRTVLGFGDNVVAKIDGALVRDDLVVRDGLVIDLETAANKKAV